MRLVTFSHHKKLKLGVLVDNDTVIVDLAKAASGLPTDMIGLINAGPSILPKAAQAVEKSDASSRVPVQEAELLAPIPVPERNIFCVGKNYFAHAHEFDKSGFNATKDASAIPEHPIFFTKPPSTVIGPNIPIPGFLDPTHSVDYEIELAVIIGQGGRSITKEAAFDHVFGYTILNDVTSRHLQSRHKQWFLGKGIDGFCPMGPCLVTIDEVGDVGKLSMETQVNDEVRQQAVVKDLIFDIPTLINTLSMGMTLQPGDIIATGTPAGVGIGFDPPKFLKKGDVVTMSFDVLGVLQNPVE